MNDENKFSVDEILEAERKAKANGAPEESEKTTPGVTEEPDAVTEPETEQPVEEASAEVAQPAPEAEPQPVEVQEDSPWDTYEEEEEPGKKKKNKKEKKEKKGFWARRREKKQKEVFNEAEDMYYGIQLKPIDEYTRGMPQVRFPRRTRDTASCLTRTPRSLTTKWQRTLSACRKSVAVVWPRP